MPVFEYRAKDNQGIVVSGNLFAEDLASAAADLQARGLAVESLGIPSSEVPRQTPTERPRTTEAPAETDPTLGERSFVAKDLVGPLVGKVGLSHLLFFFRQLATMIHAGVGMVQSLDTLSKQTRHPKLKKVVAEMRDHAHSGRPISAGMQRYPEVFSPLMLSLVRAGEKGGLLDDTLAQIADYLESEIALRQLISRETAYPKVVLVASIFIIVGANLVIGSLGNGSPLGLSSPLSTWTTWVWLGPLLIALFLFLRVGLHNPRIKHNWDFLLSVLPGFSSVVRKFATAKFGRAFGALYKGGVPMQEAVRLAADACGNEYIRSKVYPVATRLESGGGITEALRSAQVFSPIVLDMTQTGETTGNLDAMLIKMSEYYEDEAATLAKRNAIFFGVLVFLAVAVYVLFIVVGFYTGYTELLQTAG